MILGVKNTVVEARRYKDDPISGIEANINLDDVKVKGKDIEVSYTYTILYKDGVGMLKMNGILYASEEPVKAQAIEKGWKERRMPPEFAEAVLNTINFACGSEGVFVVRPLNLAPPLLPPRIEVSPPKK